MITFCFNVEPKSKGRPRFSRGGFAYTPKETREFEDKLRELAKDQYKGGPLEGALSVSVICVSKRPKKPANPYPTKDVDNMAKSVLDALIGIGYNDDSQITALFCQKEYAAVGNNGYIWVQIKSEPFIPPYLGF